MQVVSRRSTSLKYFNVRDGGRYLSFSRIADRLRCGYKHDLRWNRRIASRAIAPAMDVGSACHLGLSTALRKLAEWRQEKPKRRPTPQLLKSLEAVAAKTAAHWFDDWLKRRGGPAALTPEESELLVQLREQARAVTPRAFRATEPTRFETLWLGDRPLIEQPLVIPLPGFDGFLCHIDWVAHDLSQKQNWVIDWKFRGALLPAEDEEVDLQLALYQYVLDVIGIRTSGSGMFQARNEPPAEPKVNKDGSMSRARVATDWDTYRAALVRQRLDPQQYLDMKQKLDVVFFRLDRVYRSRDEVRNLWANVVGGVSALLDGPGGHVRSMSRMNCRGCWARTFCLAELRGDDTEWLLRTQYVDEQSPHARVVLSPDEVEFDG